jgi:hypothetical protein
MRTTTTTMLGIEARDGTGLGRRRLTALAEMGKQLGMSLPHTMTELG